MPTRRIVAQGIDSQQFSQQIIGNILGVVLRIATGSTIPRGDVQETIGRAKGQPASIVVGKGLVKGQNGASRVGVSQVGRLTLILTNYRVAAVGRGGQVHVETTIGRVVGVKRQPQQTLFVTGSQTGYGKKRRVVQNAGCQIQNPDSTRRSRALLDNKKPVRVTRSRRRKNGA